MTTPPPSTADLGRQVTARLAAVRERVAAAAERAGRDPGDVTVLLATKTVPPDVLRLAVDAGALVLGENRVQELTAKAPVLTDPAPAWHVIGHLQSNKVNAALRWASCVQTVDGLGLARKLSDRCAAVGRELDVMVQVNVSGEPSKHGVRPDDAAELAAQVAALPHLRLTGLMTIGAPSTDESAVRAGFARLRAVRDDVMGSGRPGTSGARELSMGMSGDLEPAVAEGATLVRVGSAVFGVRPPPR